MCCGAVHYVDLCWRGIGMVLRQLGRIGWWYLACCQLSGLVDCDVIFFVAKFSINKFLPRYFLPTLLLDILTSTGCFLYLFIN